MHRPAGDLTEPCPGHLLNENAGCLGLSKQLQNLAELRISAVHQMR